MQQIFTMTFLFNSWCVVTNCFLFYAEIDFLLNFWKKSDRQRIPLYIAINAVLTAAAIWTNMFLVFSVLHIALLFLLSIRWFKISAKHVITPAAIIFTLSSFREGFVAVFMQYLSSQITSERLGAFFQFALPAVSVIIFFVILHFIVKRYPLMEQNLDSSCLHILLLPSALFIGGIRTSLGLDRQMLPFRLSTPINGDLSSSLYAILWMLGTLIVFFIIIEVFHKLIMLSQYETAHALLANSIKEQYNYIDEAKQRNEGYRSFQHDINNHLLVLSGLLHSREYQQAETYLRKLNMVASSLSQQITTGNSVLDILLWEKINYAKQYKIAVACDVQIPKDSTIDEMDLCIMFANGMDNAIRACMDVDSNQRAITLTTRPKHMFLLVDMVNSASCSKPIIYGTGLKNIELTAKKYAGTLHTEQSDTQFSLSVLLCYKNMSENYEILPNTMPFTQ